MNFMRKSCLLNCWSLLLKISIAIPVHIVKCKVEVSFVSTFKIGQIFTSKLELQPLRVHQDKVYLLNKAYLITYTCI